MERLDKNAIFNIALELDLPDLLHFCRSYPKFNRFICSGQYFWNIKLNRDFPDYPHRGNARETYMGAYQEKVERARAASRATQESLKPQLGKDVSQLIGEMVYTERMRK